MTRQDVQTGVVNYNNKFKTHGVNFDDSSQE